MEDTKRWLTVAEAAAIMHVTGSGVRLMCKHGRIKARKFGNAWMIDRAAAEAYKPFKRGRKTHSA